MYKNILTALFLWSAAGSAFGSALQDGAAPSEPQIILRYNTFNGLDGVETRVLSDKITYRTRVDGFQSDGIGQNIPMLQYKTAFIQLPNEGEKFDFTIRDWRFPIGTLEGIIINMLVSVQENFERFEADLQFINKIQKTGTITDIKKSIFISIDNNDRINGLYIKADFRNRTPIYVYKNSSFDRDPLRAINYLSPFIHMVYVFAGETYNSVVNASSALETFFQGFASPDAVKSYSALSEVPYQRPGLIIIDDALYPNIPVIGIGSDPDQGPTYGSGNSTGSVLFNGYVSIRNTDILEFSKVIIQVVLDSLNYALREVQGSTPNELQPQEYFKIIQGFKLSNLRAILIRRGNPNYLSELNSFLPRVFSVEPYKIDSGLVAGIQSYLVRRAKAAGLQFGTNSVSTGLDE